MLNDYNVIGLVDDKIKGKCVALLNKHNKTVLIIGWNVKEEFYWNQITEEEYNQFDKSFFN